MNSYFCNHCEVFFQAEERVKGCPICFKRLIKNDSFAFLSELDKRCPLTFKLTTEEDPEYFILDLDLKIFHKKRIKKEIKILNFEGKIIEKNIEKLKYLTLDQYKELKKNFAKKTYIIHSNGSFTEKD